MWLYDRDGWYGSNGGMLADMSPTVHHSPISCVNSFAFHIAPVRVDGHTAVLEASLRISVPVIVSHFSPDLDSLFSTWITLRFGPYPDAGLAFVGAGQTLEGMLPDARPDIIHVDTGLGKYDHHQPEVASPDICAAKIVAHAFVPNDRALRRMVDFIVLVDNGREPEGDRTHPYGVTRLISGLNTLYPDDSLHVMHTSLPLFDAWYAASKEQVQAEDVFETNAVWFDSQWGPGVAVDHEVGPCAVLYLYQADAGRKGFNAAAGSNVDLSPVAVEVMRTDPVGEWYLHPSNKMLLNGSKKKPNFVQSPLSLPQLIDFVRV